MHFCVIMCNHVILIYYHTLGQFMQWIMNWHNTMTMYLHFYEQLTDGYRLITND